MKAMILIAALALPTAALAAPVQTYVDVAGPSGTLKGTMLAPAGKPAALGIIIPGSGPVDRDGNPPGGKASTYRLLAEGLADKGVATVRIDKRGMFASAAAGDPNKVTISDYAADMRAWIADTRKRTGAPCVWLIGHSEGALVALVTAQQPAGICGLVLLSGAGRPLGDILSEQLHFQASASPSPQVEAIVKQADGFIADLAAGRHIDAAKVPPALMALFRPAVQDFLIDEFRYDPVALVKSYPGPVLVMQGKTDIQIKPADAERLAGARPGVKLIEIDGMGHPLKLMPATAGAAVAAESDPSLPLAPGVVDGVAAFVKARR